ncbi:hypothetical protein EV714DRAFT_272248 [Schizophyllum commune]
MASECHTYIEGLERPFTSQLTASHLTLSLTRLFVVLSAVFTMVAGTESMKIPENKNATMNVQKMQKNPTVHQVN